jgi:hypothetical protein
MRVTSVTINEKTTTVSVLSYLEEAVEALTFLHEDSVHRLVVVSGVQHSNSLDVVELRQLQRHDLGHLDDLVLSRDARACGHAWLESKDDAEGVVGDGDRARDVRVVMHAEHLRLRVEWKRLYVLDVRLVRRVLVGLEGVVHARLGERVVVVQDAGREEVRDQDVARAHVFVVRDAAAVVHHRGELLQHLVRHIRVGGHVQLQLRGGDIHVGVIELVGNVPSQRSVLLAFNNDGVVEGQAEQKLLKLRGLVGATNLVVVQLHVRVLEVGTKALRGLLGDLHAVLQHRGGEGLGGHGGQPQAELGVDLVGLHGLADLLQHRHPRDGQMAVLQHDPEEATTKAQRKRSYS